MSLNAETDFKARLITAVKKEVKQVMEESVTRKFVHEESGSVTALCGAVESCLSQGLRRRALGLFKTSSTTALLHKIAKHCPEAAVISKKVQDIENMDPNRRSSSSSDSLTKPTLKKNMSLQGGAPLPKYLWIRLALFEKQLAKIIDYLVSNAPKYYDKDSLVADPDYGSILSSLLVGPCALDYSRTKTPDHFWTDPPADELVQRTRISGGTHSTPPPARRFLNYRRSLNTSSEDSMTCRTVSQHFAKDYVESLHQNSRATLLFGKNNVLVLPANADLTKPIPGYLSLHQSANSLTIKWTPNQLMNGFTDELQDKSIYWDYCLQVNMDEIVYVHCHQESESGGTIILVGQDGVQRPPIHFPKGGHMLAFLSCIETGLLPRGRLDPPLWSQRSGTSNLHNKRRRPLTTLGEAEETTKDYVFRIIDNTNHIGLKRNQLMDTHTKLPSKVRVQLGSSSTSSESSTKSFSLDQNVPDSPPSVCIRAVCDSMKRQIISRAFYGWLAYCRHLSTVRTHLSGLVNPSIISGEGAKEGLTFEKWLELCVDGTVKDCAEVYRLTYFGGITHELRKEVWPYLLGHYKFGSTVDERNQLSEETKQAYENTMSEWLAVEAIVRQRDKETQASAIAKLSSESISGDQAPNPIQRDLSNEVFEDVSDYDYESADEEEVASRKAKKTKQNTIKYESEEEHEELKGEGEAPPSECLDLAEDAVGQGDEEKEDVEREVENEIVGQEAQEEENNETVVETTSSSLVDRQSDNGGGDREVQKDNKGEAEDACKKIESSSLDTEYSSRDTEYSSVHPETPGKDMEEFLGDGGGGKMEDFIHNVIVTNASVDLPSNLVEALLTNNLDVVKEENISLDTLDCFESHGLASPARSACVSPASSNGGVYSTELLETFGLNLHRIEKDVQRCDRNYWYFTGENLDKLRNVMCTYVWEHLDIGYMQGMCDLVAPLLVVFNDESLTYACFCHLMQRMVENFPNGNAMDCHFANMRSLIQILDSEMYELMHSHGDYTHFYFCYRWFLLDFKRELVYPDVFATWEVIWAAQHVASGHFVLFLALALLETYRDIILLHTMDFTDIIKFFNGLGLGLIMPATFVAVSSYFNTRKQLAVSFSMVGTSVGQITMPHVVSALLNEFGYRGTTLIMGGLCLNGLIGALLFHPVQWHMKPSMDGAESKGLLSKEEKIIQVEKVVKSVKKKEAPGVWRHIVKTLDLGLLKDLVFLHITTGIGLVYTCSIAFSMVFPFFLLHTVGLDREKTAICMSFLAGADILARLVVPLLGAHFALSNRLTFLIGAGVLALCRTFLILQSSFALVALGAFMCGFARAATVVYQNLTVSEYVEEDKIPSAVGLNMVTKALFVLSVGQFFGWVRDTTQSFPMCIFAQNVVLVTVSISWSLEIAVRWLRRKENEFLQVAGNF